MNYEHKYNKYKDKYYSKKMKNINHINNNKNNNKMEKTIKEPWLTYIKNGEKTYEGRLNRGFWAKVKIGDKIIFKSNINTVETEVIDLKYYDTFGDAWFDLRKKLIPFEISNKTDADKTYLNIFKQQDIDEYGVVAVGIKLI